MASHRKGWQHVPVVDLCEVHVDCVNRTAPVVDEPTPFKMIRTTNVRNGFIDAENVRFVTEDTYRRWTRRLVPKRGDVILTREAPLGGVGKIRTDDSIFLGQRLYHFRPDPKKLDGDFLLYSLMGEDLQGQIRGFGSGATVEHMRLEDIPSLMIHAPHLPAQRRIGAMLSTYDDLIENNTKRIKILEEMARSLYREWFVNFRFPGHEKTKLVSSRAGKIPEGWRLTSLDEASVYINRGVAPKYADDGPELVINQKCVRDQHLSLEPARRHQTKVPPDKYVHRNDVLINSTGVGTLGRVAQVLEDLDRVAVDTHVSIVRPRPDVDPDYFGLSLLALEAHFEAQGAGATGQTELARARIGATPLLLPAESLQRRFGQVVRDLRVLPVMLAKKNDILCATRDLLLPRLISGEIDVSSLPLEPAAS